MKLAELVEYLDAYLEVDGFPDYAGAVNGLQVENGGEVSRIAAAVDASQAAVEAAAEAACDLLLVHHGLFWGGLRPVTGRRYRALRTLLRSDVAVYSAHLPLDAHPEVGNCAVLARELEIEPAGRFGEHEGRAIGWWGRVSGSREELTRRIEDAVGGSVRLIAGGPDAVRRVGIVTGGASGLLEEAVEQDLDTFITGEGPHHTYFAAMEEGMNLYYAGHYATETWGVRALARHLEERFGIPWEFLDFPTGL